VRKFAWALEWLHIHSMSLAYALRVKSVHEASRDDADTRPRNDITTAGNQETIEKWTLPERVPRLWVCGRMGEMEGGHGCSQLPSKPAAARDRNQVVGEPE
jgi:hypothetical protein